MALALYRRYRPDTFAGVIGQDQVTVPLMRALDEGKLTHAYLFSGPRGCGKTSSARILARCVNCAKGPTSHPCGECESCKDLATGGPGSIDVVEIDAASHNGVDDARELRERAGFAPARDRYKIFILDEAHMVTQQGFNALLKIVEEPPEHVMFIFATTEPDKVIGTIRSRTHHYPFRLVPQEVMGPYLETICEKEHIKAEPGVLKLAMRAGGGSVRDTLSVLDQLMVGSVDGVITHDAAVALLGFTPEALIGEAVDAVIDHNGEALYGVIQKVVIGGFDPRRFVEDLLARVRDLLVLTLAGDRAESVLSDTAEAEDMDDLHRQAKALGLGALTAMAEIINTTLGAMTGAISPRMRLELLAARLLAGSETGFAVAVPGVAGADGVGAPGAPQGGVTGGAHGAAAGTAGGAASGGFAGASRGGFVGASHGGFSGAERNQRQAAGGNASVSQRNAGGAAGGVQAGGWSTDGFTGPQAGGNTVSTVAGGAQQAAANAQDGTNDGWGAGAGAGAGAARPATADNRSTDEKWDAAVAGLPDAVREYVTRGKVPTVRFGTNRKGLPCLSMTFDKPLSQHAFALAVDTDSGKKASAVVMDAVRKEFGPTAVIAPTAVAANGERVESVKRMSPEQLAKVKQQIALAKAGLAASSLGAGLGMRAGSEPKTPKPESQPKESDDIHRAGTASDAASQPGVTSGSSTSSWAEDDPWAKPVADAADTANGTAVPDSGSRSEMQPDASAMPATDGFAPAEASVAAPQHEEHHKKHVAVPDVSDGVDPWAVPAQPAAPKTAAPTADDPWAGGASSRNDGSSASSEDPWAGAQSGSGAGAVTAPQQVPAGQPAGATQPTQSRANPAAASVGAKPRSIANGEDPWAGVPPAEEPPMDDGMGPDPWNQPQSSTPENDPWNQPVASAGRSSSPMPSEADPWNQPAAPSPDQTGRTGGAGRWDQQPNQTLPPAGPPAGLSADPWNQQAPSQAGPQADPQSGPQVAAEDDEYSMNDQSLGEASAMSLDDLKKMFEVKKVEEYSADDPKNPRNMQAAKKPEE